MLAKRLLVAIVLIPIGIGFIALGGPVYVLAVALIMGLAAWEYNLLFRMCGFLPAAWIGIGGVVVICLSRAVFQFRGAGALLSALTLVAMAFHLFTYEYGRNQAASDMAITLGALLYIGWLGAYFVSLRSLPDGEWWVLTALPAVWIGDAGALLAGTRLGRHKLSPRLSPNKTWEGYFGGVITCTLSAALLAGLWHLVTPAITLERGALLGLALGALTPLGDLGESMIKRQAGAKDSSQLIPGHGGVLDRIDSWLWAGVIGYYMIVILW